LSFQVREPNGGCRTSGTLPNPFRQISSAENPFKGAHLREPQQYQVLRDSGLFGEVGAWDAYAIGIMEKHTQTNLKKNSEQAMSLGATALLGEANSEHIFLFNKPQSTEQQPTWVLDAVFFIIELP